MKTECVEDGYIICEDLRVFTRFTTILPGFVFRPNNSGETTPRDRLVGSRGDWRPPFSIEVPKAEVTAKKRKSVLNAA